ncbi:hypothetical protein BGZ76_001066 [Entomortierella beljakovae]|nr:hypothetical protein BGZ76_001066 [Entomortierella beljakovae]
MLFKTIALPVIVALLAFSQVSALTNGGDALPTHASIVPSVETTLPVADPEVDTLPVIQTDDANADTDADEHAKWGWGWGPRYYSGWGSYYPWYVSRRYRYY